MEEMYNRGLVELAELSGFYAARGTRATTSAYSSSAPYNRNSSTRPRWRARARGLGRRRPAR